MSEHLTAPSVGRIVHYVSHGTPIRPDGTQAFPSVCRAAVVTQVGDHPDADGTVGLCVLNPTGLFFQEAIDHAEDHVHGHPHPPGTWHWPERV